MKCCEYTPSKLHVFIIYGKLTNLPITFFRNTIDDEKKSFATLKPGSGSGERWMVDPEPPGSRTIKEIRLCQNKSLITMAEHLENQTVS